MSEYFDYFSADDQYAFPDLLRNSDSVTSLRIERLWPYGQTKLSCALGDTHAIELVDYAHALVPHIEAIAKTPTGIFRLRYDATGILSRVRVRATNMIIEGCDHVAADPDAKLHARTMAEYDDAIITMFPQRHMLTVQHYGFTLRQAIVQPDKTMRGATIDLPQFPDIRFAAIYTQHYFSFSTMFPLSKQFAETFITSEIAIPKSIFTDPNQSQIHELGCDILGL